MTKPTYYITTPIYYPSGYLHIGNAYCTVAADTMARYKRLCGYDVMFLTGTDEHGQKIEERAKAAGVTPQQFVDKIVAGPGGILELWKLMDISNDRFIRSTDDYHVQSIQTIFRKMYENGDIYKGAYKGLYCTPCESFWTESQLVGGKCPDCGREVKEAEEEAYFFRLSKYADRVRDLLVNTDFLEPRSRINEMVNNFIDPGLEDLCVSRTSIKWGIPVDFDPKHVVYVWIDALSNYMTALGLYNNKYHDVEKYWPCDVHFVGKEIVRFHSIVWPAMLMSLELPLPRKVFGHGWLLGVTGDKMSKSKGNIVDPVILVDRYGVDAIRYFLMREFTFGIDGNFSNELLISRINSDLANDWGNLVSRTVAMAEKYFGGKLPRERRTEPADGALIERATALRAKYAAQMEKFAFQNALTEVFAVVSLANKYIDETAPWVLARDEENKGRLASVLNNLLEAIRICAILLTPFMPSSCEKVFAQTGVPESLRGWGSADTWGLLPEETEVRRGEALFPRIDMAKELASLDALLSGGEPSASPVGGDVHIAPALVPPPPPSPIPPSVPAPAPPPPPITIDDFAKVRMTVCKVLGCERVAKSDKLLKFSLDDGSGQKRQIFSGIAKYHAPEELIGKTVVACTNLQPRKMMGQESCGMLLSAEKNGGLQLLTLPDEIPAGAVIG